jgi:prepilin-type N-terminal cleavage/methylation domain-containing protein
MTSQRRTGLPTARGFTLIEIVLVLALAGLILLVVFLAVSGAQRSKRDYQRKQDLAQFTAAFDRFAENHHGQIPTTQAEAQQVFDIYATNRKDPYTGQNYVFQYRDIGLGHEDVPDVGTVYYQRGHWCNTGPDSGADNPTDPIAGDDATVLKFALWTGIEAGGLTPGSLTTGAAACNDNF